MKSRGVEEEKSFNTETAEEGARRAQRREKNRSAGHYKSAEEKAMADEEKPHPQKADGGAPDVMSLDVCSARVGPKLILVPTFSVTRFIRY